MSAPNYSPGPNSVGKTVTDTQGNTYRFDGIKWVQISEAPVRQSIPATTTSTQKTVATPSNQSSASPSVDWKANLISALTSKGYNLADAQNAANGPRAEQLAAEYGVTGAPATNSSSSGSNTLQDVNKTIEDSFNSLVSDAISKFGTYQQNNPFNLDQVLADKTKQAAEQIDPYYNETITNYLTGVNNKIQRSNQDAQQVLDELNTQAQNFTQRNQASLASAVENAKQGFANAGLLTSGAALGNQGETTVTSNQNLADYLRGNAIQQRTTNQNLARNLTDIGLSSTQNLRDIGRQQYTDVQTRAADLTKQAGQQYVAGFQATLPPQLQAATGFDLLKQLGITS